MAVLKDILKDKLNESELKSVKRGFDIIGDIAQLEIPPELFSKRRIIADAVMKLHKNVRTVVMKSGGTSGIERIRKVEWIKGDKKTETIHVENGVRLKLDLNKVYFSPRLGTEHLAVVNQIKKNEVVYDLFAGVGPYAIPAAKRAKKVIAIDINKDAIKYLEENAKLNKVQDKIDAYDGDCRKVVKRLKAKNKADRIIMNLPMHAGEFLDVAFYIAKPGAIVHCYFFLDESEMYQKAVKKIKEVGEKFNRKTRILRKRKCGQLYPRVWRCVVDFKIY